MNIRLSLLSRFILLITMFLHLLSLDAYSILKESTTIDHQCTCIDEIPAYWIIKAKMEFRIAYGHTSHGSQIISGMQVLMNKSDLYSFNHDGTGGALSLHDQRPAGDLGNPNRTEWYYRTKNLLDDPYNSFSAG